MRITVMIISLCLVMLVGLQSCTVMLGGGLGEDEGMAGSGAIGLLVSLLFLLGGAFALGAPKVSMVIFVVAALLGIMAAAVGPFSDMQIWAYVSLALAALSYFGIGEKKKLEAKRSGSPESV